MGTHDDDVTWADLTWGQRIFAVLLLLILGSVAVVAGIGWAMVLTHLGK